MFIRIGILIFLLCTPPVEVFAQEQAKTSVTFISLAPSPYTSRHDCMRAGFGIYLLLKGPYRAS